MKESSCSNKQEEGWKVGRKEKGGRAENWPSFIKPGLE